MRLAESGCAERTEVSTSRKTGGYFTSVMQIMFVIENLTITRGK